MKTAASLAPFLLAGLVLAGCGSAHAVMTFKTPTKITLANAQTGARIACQRGPTSPVMPNGRLITGAVPAPGKTAGGLNGLDGNGIDIYLDRKADGSLVANCSS
jgi:hypothetical protein